MTRTRTLTTALALVATLTVAACGSDGEEPAGPAESGSVPGETSDSAGDGSGPSENGADGAVDHTGSGEEQSGAPAGGCEPTDADVPAGAATGESADLDGDGEADELWLGGDQERMLGVRTASGAVFSVEFSAGAPQAAAALGQRLGDGSAIVLLNTGRSVGLYAVIGCELAPTMNEDGEPYTFDLGFTGFGTGVGCVDLGGGLKLVGLFAESDESGEQFTVTRTAIELDDAGSSASNGETETVATDVGPQDPEVVSAQEVSCGETTAEVTEPR